MTPSQFRNALLNQVAYIKPVMEGGEKAYSIHAADGAQLAIMTDEQTARAAVKAHDLEPVSVH